MAKQESPLERVAREMARECEMEEETIRESLYDLVCFLRKRAADSIVLDENSKNALINSRQYWALAALIEQFGTALLAFDDIEESELLPPVSVHSRN
jgi:hypothetical protein